jgi:hypothetical protein
VEFERTFNFKKETDNLKCAVKTAKTEGLAGLDIATKTFQVAAYTMIHKSAHRFDDSKMEHNRNFIITSMINLIDASIEVATIYGKAGIVLSGLKLRR